MHMWHTASTNYRPPCPCARVNDANEPFLGEGPSAPFPKIGTSRLQHADTVYN